MNEERFAGIYRWLRVFEQTTPALRACPSLLRRGMVPNYTCNHEYRAKPSRDVDLLLPVQFTLDSSALLRRGLQANHTSYRQHSAKPSSDVDPRLCCETLSWPVLTLN